MVDAFRCSWPANILFFNIFIEDWKIRTRQVSEYRYSQLSTCRRRTRENSSIPYIDSYVEKLQQLLKISVFYIMSNLRDTTLINRNCVKNFICPAIRTTILLISSYKVNIIYTNSSVLISSMRTNGTLKKHVFVITGYILESIMVPYLSLVWNKTEQNRNLNK